MNTIATAEQRESTKPAHAGLFPRIRTLMDLKRSKQHLLNTAGPDMQEYMMFHATQAMYRGIGFNPTIRNMETLRHTMTSNTATH